MAKQPETVRFAIMGCADIARKLARAIALAPNATLSAVASRSLQKAQTFAAQNALPDTVSLYGSYHELLDDPSVDAVYLPLPTSLHVQWAVAAASRRKHVLLEKPGALNTADLDRILEACESNGVQFMDGSMWLHHPRTSHMHQLLSLSHSGSIGNIQFIHSTSTMHTTPGFLESNIRVKAELDALGALGDLAWYCIGASLWAKSYQLPATVIALPDVTRNAAGVILSITASLHWDQPNQTEAIIHCSFLSHTSMDLAISASNGSLHVKDFIIPFREDIASFDFTFGAKFVDLHIGWNVKPEQVNVPNLLPQEALMVQHFATLVAGIRDCASSPDNKWPEITRKTQVVVDAVNKSLDLGCKPVFLWNE
ncbi:hypothetical protein PIB30_004785 [Stylosanthes scabra]|uniref:Gfo/Idh/MocA-like oxidoreductase N-terminal domain-containing protein n=1 Tax=Stylosanthes scabra TaxID=79078 RepID=A0ABU6T3L7_9FABA|nr:hypothetical protein [Stylosanthes scabra]